MSTKKTHISFFEALIPVLFLITALSFNVFVFKDEALKGSNQIILIMSAVVAALIAWRKGHTWMSMQNGIVKSIASALPSILILLLIGSLAGTWLLSGIVPAMIYYGLQILNPTIFLFASCFVCAMVSLITGSSWSTAATIGIALVGIGNTLGLHQGLVVGAIISGAYFGDKISPLSDTTNLAAAMTETDLFVHIRYMLLTTIPSFSIALLLYLILGFTATPSSSASDIESVLTIIQSTFNINWMLFIVPAVVIFLIVKKVHAVPVLFIGTILGAVFAIIFQPEIVREVSGGASGFKAIYTGTMKAMYTRISISVDNEFVKDLFTAGGMSGMLNTIWLIISAMTFGGVMEGTGLLNAITERLLRVAKTRGSLIASTTVTCAFLNTTASDQYLSIIIPGKMYADAFKKMKLKSENLSRTLEDSGTVTSVLVPWNTCGATQSTVLGVATFVYAPFCFFNIISPFMTMLYGFLGIKIKYIEDKYQIIE